MKTPVGARGGVEQFGKSIREGEVNISKRDTSPYAGATDKMFPPNKEW